MPTMKRLPALLVIGLLAAAAVSCRKHDFRTMAIDVPGMRNARCAQLVQQRLQQVPGVLANKIAIDLENRIVTVTYDSLQLSLKNIEFAIAEAGFDANDVPATPAARDALPPECKP